MNSNISSSIVTQTREAADAVETLSEFARAFTAIEDLMRPADSSNHQSLRFVDRDDLTSLIGVVNNAFKRQLDETRKAARDVVHAAHALHAPNVSFAEELVAEALWPAAAKDVLVATLDHAATPPKASGGASFGEGAAGLDRKSP